MLLARHTEGWLLIARAWSVGASLQARPIAQFAGNSLCQSLVPSLDVCGHMMVPSLPSAANYNAVRASIKQCQEAGTTALRRMIIKSDGKCLCCLQRQS